MSEEASELAEEPKADAEPVQKPGFRFRFRLWMLFLPFIPAAYWAMYFGTNFEVTYTESRDSFVGFDEEHISFGTLPDGTATNMHQNIDDAYQSLGVSFSFGTPNDLEQKKWHKHMPAGEVRYESIPIQTQPTATNRVSRAGPNNNAASSGKKSAAGPAVAKPGNAQTILNRPTTAQQGYVGISGFPFRYQGAEYDFSIATYEKLGTKDQLFQGTVWVNSGYKYRRFQGPLTIRFHEPNDPAQTAGVKNVGLFAARLNVPETLEVRLYAPDGKFIARQTNLDHTCVFMGFSCDRKIGWIEIEAIGNDEDYAITGLVFDKLK